MERKSEETVGHRLRVAIDQHWVRPEGHRTSIRAFQREMEKRAENPRVVKELRGVSYPTINSYLKNSTKPSLGFLKEAADVLGVRHGWLAVGEGAPTVSENEILEHIGRAALKGAEDPSPGRQLRNEIEERHEAFWRLSPWARDRFLVILSRLALTAPDGADLVETEKGRDQLAELAGDLLWYITLPLNWKPYRDPENEERRIRAWGFIGNPATLSGRTEEQFLDTMLLALDRILLGPGQGETVEEAPRSPLRWLRQIFEETVERIEERNKEIAEEEGIDDQGPRVGDRDPEEDA